MPKLKYVRTKEYNQIIIFPTLTNHSEFANLGIISAGFCYVDGATESVECSGKSVSLRLESLPDDSKLATLQIFGEEQ